MDTLNHILDKYNVTTWEQGTPVYLDIGRFKDVPRLFAELGFKTGVEVGVHEGSYSKWLLRYCPGLKLTGVDLWESYPGYKDFQPNNLSEAHQKAIDNVKGYDCTFIQDWSHNAADQFEDESLDFVFIDGNHMYEWVVMDIANWSKKVRPGGIVYGHDYDDYTDSKRWNEMSVIPAVDGWVKAHKIAPLFIVSRNRNKSWLYVKS